MHPYSIPFNKPFLTGKEMHYMYQAVYSGQISGNGIYTKKCQQYLEVKYNIKKVLMTTSCTDALEMSAILSKIKPGDEVIVPSFTFVSTALAFVRQGATIVFADSHPLSPNIDAEKIETLISKKTKAIVVVHYAGIACDMDRILKLANNYKLIVIEDAAQSLDAYYKGKPLGCLGQLSCFSFHETKNLQCGEGGSIWINDEALVNRAEIIWEKGTNRSDFSKGIVSKYEWVDIGSSFLPSEINSAYLYAQLEFLESIQTKRKSIWNTYHSELQDWAQVKGIRLPFIPDYASNNAHMFYMICTSALQRDALINYLKGYGILAVSHYLSLHKSPFYHSNYNGPALINCDQYADGIIRLPLYYELSETDLHRVIDTIKSFRH